MKENNKMLQNEIKTRLESDSWDFAIAHGVFQKRELMEKKSFRLWSYASLATAAMSLMIFISGIYTSTVSSSSYTDSGSIYSYSYINNAENFDNDTIAAGVELTINEAYPMR